MIPASLDLSAVSTHMLFFFVFFFSNLSFPPSVLYNLHTSSFSCCNSRTTLSSSLCFFFVFFLLFSQRCRSLFTVEDGEAGNVTGDLPVFFFRLPPPLLSITRFPLSFAAAAAAAPSPLCADPPCYTHLLLLLLLLLHLLLLLTPPDDSLAPHAEL